MEDKKAFLNELHRRYHRWLKPLIKVRVDFSLTCTGYDGIDAIKEALLTAKHEVNDEKKGEWQQI